MGIQLRLSRHHNAQEKAPGAGGPGAFLRRFPRGLMLTAAVAAGVLMGYSPVAMYSPMPALWPPIGIIFASLCLTGARDLPWLALGLMPLLLGVPSRMLLPATLLLISQIGCCGVAAFALRRHNGFNPALPTLRDVAALLTVAISLAAIAGLFPSLFMGMVGMPLPLLLRNSIVSISSMITGVVLFAPAIMTMVRERADREVAVRHTERLALFAALNIATALTVFSGMPPGYLLVPFVIWSAVRFGQRETSVVVAVGTMWILLQDHVDAHFAGHQQIFVLGIDFTALLAVVGLVVGALNAERRAAVRGLLEARGDLELRVAARTQELDRANALLSAAKERADQASRSKSHFLAGMSHEIRNPLNSILGFSQLLLDGPLDDDQRGSVAKMRRAGENLRIILDDLLDFSKIEAGLLEFHPRSCSPQDIAEAALQMMGPKATERGLAMFMHCAPSVPELIEADPARVGQVLTNFLANAIKYTDSGGSVTLRIDRDPTDAKALRFEVIDTGIGVDPDRQHLLFRRYSQLPGSSERRIEGVGLGLAICKRLTEAMPRGRIGVISNGKQGSIFWFSAHFPVKREAACEPLPEPPQPQHSANVAEFCPPGSRPLRVLVAEDGMLNQEVMQRFLTGAGHRVTQVMDGRQAVEAARRVRFDLILMDIAMPNMDGIEATRLIRAMAGPGAMVPVIAITGDAMVEKVAFYRGQGITDVLAKPVDRCRLLRAIDRVTGRNDIAAAPECLQALL